MKNKKQAGKAKIYDVSSTDFQSYAEFFENNELEEMIVEEKGTKIIFRKNAPISIPQTAVMTAAAPVAASAPVATATPATAAQEAAPATEDDSKYEKVLSPLNGTFYASATPDDPPMVAAGQQVSVGTVLCIVEAMKNFNELKAEVSGTISKILVKNNDPIQEDQVLFLIDPS